MIFMIVFVIAMVAIDQITKLLTLVYIKPVSSVEIIKNILSFTYVENRGAAFGILQNARWVFIIFTLAIIAALIVYTVKAKPSSRLYHISTSLIIAGGIGNLIDRIFRGYVVDMIEATFIDYPVFNFADCCVVVGAILFCIYVLKYDLKTETDNGNN